MVTSATPAKTDFRTKAKLFRGLADSSRLSVIESLREGPRCVSEIIAATGLSQPNVSNHLACLRDCGLVTREQQGRFVIYQLADPTVAALLSDVDSLVDLIHERIEDCPNYDEAIPFAEGATVDASSRGDAES